jgi:hypothetical protein
MTMAIVLAAAGAAQAGGLEPGLWQLTTRAEINGGMAPPQQSMRCLKPEDVADLDKTFSPVFNTVNSACERTEHEASPQRVKWRLICKGQVDMDVAGEFVFETPQRYVARMATTASMMGRPMQNSRSVIEATRVGECK